MTLARVHLGTAPGQYKLAFDGCSAFKRQLRSVLATPAGASLLTVTDHGTMWVEAVYPAGVPGADAWAKRAAELASEIWATLVERRTVRGRA
ncbi:hypothetical protein J8F10_09160 [Gemmata sp. G18]|uniref:Uncharacterized protein n=1 Tax=Gemmata palustris TaxID=2822762 RepID=A0ABS5BNZ1_9BACT|nr:hypothetical protein [Gemmata palustris]MBP3955449.1 hypothetical protein [Gemmata palustris]